MDKDQAAAVERVRAFIAARRSMMGFTEEILTVGVKGDDYTLDIRDLMAMVSALAPEANMEPLDRRGLDAKRRPIDWAAAHRAEAESIIRRGR